MMGLSLGKFFNNNSVITNLPVLYLRPSDFDVKVYCQFWFGPTRLLGGISERLHNFRPWIQLIAMLFVTAFGQMYELSSRQLCSTPWYTAISFRGYALQKTHCRMI